MLGKKEFSTYKAAATFKVPRKTLNDRVKDHIKHGSKPGPTTVLSPDEEDSLESYLFYMADRGYPLTISMVKAYDWAIANRTGQGHQFNKEFGPGEHWWSNFRKQHPKVTLRWIDLLEHSHSEALYMYFQLLHMTFG